mgnify:CR=1 FL=1
MRWKDLRESKKESIINEKEAAVKKNEEVKPEKKNVWNVVRAVSYVRQNGR